MMPDQFYDLLLRYGVHRLEWREAIVQAVVKEIGDAQVRAAIFGSVVATIVVSLIFLGVR